MKVRLLAVFAVLLGFAWAPLAAAAIVSYTFEGAFTGATSGDASTAAMQSAGAGLLGTQALSLTLTFDTAAAGGPGSNPAATVYRPAIVAASASFAGYGTVSNACPPGGTEFICSIHVTNGAGGFADPDSILLFPAIMSSAAFQSDLGEARPLSLQFIALFADFAGNPLADDSLAFDPTALAGWTGNLSVFAPLAAGGFERANFAFGIRSVALTEPGGSVPEPGALALMGLALAAAAMARRRVPRN